MSAEKLVIQGGKRVINDDFDSPDPLPEIVHENVKKVLDSNRLWRYKVTKPEDSQVSLLEKEFADYLGVKYALAVHSCSAAMFIGLLAANVKFNDKVLTSAFTFTAVPSTIMHAGAVPVLVETTDNYCLDIEDLKKKIGGIKFFILSHMRGHISDMDEIVNICKKNDIFLIEDCAHSLGAYWKGISTGKFGKIGCFSFQAYKIINAGEGGMLVTNDEEVFAKSVFYSGAFENYWQKHIIKTDLLSKYQKIIPVYNLRMSEVTAAIARPQISLIADKIKKYNENYNAMIKVLSRSPYINIPKRDARSSFAPDTIQFTISSMSRNELQELIKVLELEGIEMYYFGTDYNVRFYKNWEYLQEMPNLPKTSQVVLSTCELRLPFFIKLNEIETIGTIVIKAIDYIKNACKS